MWGRKVCYIIKGMILLYESFFVNYILFTLARLWTSQCLLVQVQKSDGVVLHPCRKDLTIIICHNKSPDRKCSWIAVGVDWVSGWRQGQKRCPENLKRPELTSGHWSARLVFSNLIKAYQFGSQLAEVGWDLGYHKMYHAWRWKGSQHSVVSICFCDLCLSSCVAKDWR